MAEPRTRSAAPTLAIGLFARHYLEMVVAMAVGMAVFGVLFMSPLDPIGHRATLRAHPYIRELLMLVAMALPMAAFMLFRGHRVERTAEMVAGMAAPALVVIALTAFSITPVLTVAALPLWSHVAMLAGMLATMLCRRAEYASAHSHAHGPASARPPGEHHAGRHDL